MQHQALLESPLQKKRGRMNNEALSGDTEEVLSNKSSPGKIQSSQKEIDEFFENFQQQIQVKFLNFEDTVQDCDFQVKKCLNKIFETEIIKEKKQIQTFSARPPSAQKKNKLIYLNPFKNIDNNFEAASGLDALQTINSGAPPSAFNPLQDNSQGVTTSDFTESLNTANQINTTTVGGTQKLNCYQTIKNFEGTGQFLPTLGNAIYKINGNLANNNFGGISSRFRAHSINDTVSDQLHKQFVQQRNNCNTGDNIFSMRDHKVERQRILSNEPRQVAIKQLQNPTQIGVVKHPYLNYIQNKESEQQQQQQNFMQSLRNAFRITFNNPNQNQQKDLQKTLKNQQEAFKQQLTQVEIPEESPSFFAEQKDNSKFGSNQTPQISTKNSNNQNQNVKVFKRKDRNFRPSWNENNQVPLPNLNVQNDNINQNNTQYPIKENTNNNLRSHSNNAADTNHQTARAFNGQMSDNLQEELITVSSQQQLLQLQEMQSHRNNHFNATNLMNTQNDHFESTEHNLLARLDTQITQDSSSQTNLYQKCKNFQTTVTQANEDFQNENRPNQIISDKPKKKVIKISKESVFCKIIQEQKEKQTARRDGSNSNSHNNNNNNSNGNKTQVLIATKVRNDNNYSKQRSNDFQETRNPFSNQNFQIYQDQNLLQQYMVDNQSLQQKVKMFKFNKKISNKTENAITQKTEHYAKADHLLIQDKENISENILSNFNEQNNESHNLQGEQVQPQKRTFKRNISFHRKNQFYNDGNNKDLKNNFDQQSYQKRNVFSNDAHSPNALADCARQYKFIPSKYDIEEIRSSIFLKKSITQQETGGNFFKNQLQQKQNEIENSSSNEKKRQKDEIINNSSNYSNIHKDQRMPIDQQQLKSSILRQSKQFKDKVNSNSNLSNSTTSSQLFKQSEQSNNNTHKVESLTAFNNNLYEPSLERRQNKHKTFNSILNGCINNGVNNNNNTKKLFGLNLSIEDMIIQNIDDFKEKIIKNQ